MLLIGQPGWLSGLAPAFSPGSDPGDPGSSPTSGSLHGACFSLCLCLCLSWINKFLKILKNKIKFLLLLYISNYENYCCSFPIPTLLILIFGWLQFPIHCHPVYWLPVFLGFQYVYRWSFQHLHFWHLESSPLMFLFFTLQKQLTTILSLQISAYLSSQFQAFPSLILAN